MPLWQLVGGSIPWLVALSGAGVIMLLVIFLLLQWRDRSRLIPGIPYVKPIVPYLGEVGTFLPKPTDFYERNKKEHGEMFSFTLLGRTVVVFTTVELGMLYWKAPTDVLDLRLGYAELFKRLQGPEAFEERMDAFHALLNTAFFRRGLEVAALKAPEELDKQWQTPSSLDPDQPLGTVSLFTTIYNVTFRMSAWVLAGAEIADKHFNEFSECFGILDRDFSALNLFLPGLPTAAAKRRNKAHDRLRTLIKDVATQRQKDSVQHDDGLARLMKYYTRDGVVDVREVTHALMSVLFAAQTNTALMIGWAIIRILTNRDVLQTVLAEMAEMDAKHGAGTANALDGAQFLEKCVYETIRLSMFGATWRLVLQPWKVKNVTIPAGSLVLVPEAYQLTDPTLFPDPLRFDPHRFDNPETFAAFVGFGAGFHPCLGKKLALAEAKVILTAVLRNYEIELPKQLPEIDTNNLHGVWPKSASYVRVTRKTAK